MGRGERAMDMPDDDDSLAAAEIRRLREDQRQARSSAVGWLVALAVVAALIFGIWENQRSADREAEKLGDCLRARINTPAVQC